MQNSGIRGSRNEYSPTRGRVDKINYALQQIQVGVENEKVIFDFKFIH